MSACWIIWWSETASAFPWPGEAGSSGWSAPGPKGGAVGCARQGGSGLMGSFLACPPRIWYKVALFEPPWGNAHGFIARTLVSPSVYRRGNHVQSLSGDRQAAHDR